MFRTVFAVALMAAPATNADVWSFETPSRNIQCWVGVDIGISDLTCTIIERYGAPAAPRPPGCAADWGHVFFMNNRGPVYMKCEPLDRSRNAHYQFEYGTSDAFGGINCHSSGKGLDCRNQDGHGFFLSRAQQLVF